MSSNNSSFNSNQTNKSELDNDPRFTGKAHPLTFQFVNDDFPPLPQLPFYCPYVDDDGQPEFATRKEYIDFCKKHAILVLDDKQLRAIGDQYERELKQELIPTFYCPYDNLEGKRDETGKLLPRFQTRSEYDSWCKENKRDPLNDLELIALGKRWADQAELARLQVGCRDYLDYLEAQWWDTC